MKRNTSKVVHKTKPKRVYHVNLQTNSNVSTKKESFWLQVVSIIVIFLIVFMVKLYVESQSTQSNVIQKKNELVLGKTYLSVNHCRERYYCYDSNYLIHMFADCTTTKTYCEAGCDEEINVCNVP